MTRRTVSDVSLSFHDRRILHSRRPRRFQPDSQSLMSGQRKILTRVQNRISPAFPRAPPAATPIAWEGSRVLWAPAQGLGVHFSWGSMRRGSLDQFGDFSLGLDGFFVPSSARQSEGEASGGHEGPQQNRVLHSLSETSD
jgi:hypothetical protein